MSEASRANDYPALGSRWREDDKRFERYVVVVAIEPERGARCVGIKNEAFDGVTWARPERFGKSGGYRPAPRDGEQADPPVET